MRCLCTWHRAMQPVKRSLHGHDHRIRNYQQLKFTDLGRRLMLAGVQSFVSRLILGAVAGRISRAEGRGSESSLCHRHREVHFVS